MENYFLIHGSYGNPYKNWFPWLKNELAKRKYECIVPSFTIGDKQNYSNWSKILKTYLDIGCINENTIFITHSLGSIFIIKFLIDNKVKINKLITVAGFNNVNFEDDINLYNTFYVDNDDIKKIYNYCNNIVSIYSDNDSYVKVLEAEKFANSINSNRILINNGGHFSKNDGYTEFKDMLDYI